MLHSVNPINIELYPIIGIWLTPYILIVILIGYILYRMLCIIIYIYIR